MCKTLLKTSIKGYVFGSACRHTLNTCLAPYHDISVRANFRLDAIAYFQVRVTYFKTP